MNPNEAKLLKIQEKIFQVSKIKDLLEVRRQKLIEKLKNSTNSNKSIIYLSQLSNIYQREENVISICEKGLVEAIAILGEVKVQVSENGESRFKNMVKAIFMAGRTPTSIIPLLKKMITYLEIKTKIIVDNLVFIKSNISYQKKQVEELIEQYKLGYIKENIENNRTFKKMEELHDEELEMVKLIEKESKYKGKIVHTSSKINEILYRHKWVYRIQGSLIIPPIGWPIITYGVIQFGAEFAPLFAVIGYSIKWSPTIALLSVKSAKSGFKKIKRK